MITSFDVQYGQVDGSLTVLRIRSSITSYTVIGLMPFTEYSFRVAGVNREGPGPYSAFIGPIRTNEDGRLKFNFSYDIMHHIEFLDLLCSTGSCVRSDRLCQDLHHGAILESSSNA